MSQSKSVSDEINEEKIRRALRSGPAAITEEATVAEFGQGRALTVLRKGTNHWVCVPGNENLIGQADMCLDPMGMQWMLDVMARKPIAHCHARRRNVGDVCRHSIRASTCMRISMERQ
jgi:hypothetical protein